MSTLRVVLVSEGIVKGNAYIYKLPILYFDCKNISREEVDGEKQRVKDAVACSLEELANLKQTTQENLGEQFAHIFRSHQTIAEDESMCDEVFEYIEKNLVNAEVALSTVYDTYQDMFLELEEGVNKERATDLNDVSKRILRNLLGLPEMSMQALPENTIIVAEELNPSDTVTMDIKNVKGFVTEKGGVTSHVAIIARSYGIPAVCGIDNLLDVISQGDEVLLAATQKGRSRIFLSANETEYTLFNEEKKQYENYRNILESVRGKESITEDGHKVILSANISDDNVSNEVVQEATSVGLFRTEFLFMKKVSLPGEEEQYQAYKKVAMKFNPNMVVFRTLDIGGDKKMPCLKIPNEDNPFLGYRGIRIGLDDYSVLIPQLRAMIRASAHGDVKIMFPMVDSLRQITILKSIVKDIVKDLTQKEIPHNKNIDIGIMIEIPSMLLLLDEVAEEVDFVSIGTNDLTQYLLAVDRTNMKIRDYYRPFHPVVFRAIDKVCRAMHKKNKWVGICGELAGIKEAIPALVGLGVDELSMSPRILPEATFIIRGINKKKAENLAKNILTLSLEQEVDIQLAKAYYKISMYAQKK